MATHDQTAAAATVSNILRKAWCKLHLGFLGDASAGHRVSGPEEEVAEILSSGAGRYGGTP